MGDDMTTCRVWIYDIDSVDIEELFDSGRKKTSPLVTICIEFFTRIIIYSVCIYTDYNNQISNGTIWNARFNESKRSSSFLHDYVALFAQQFTSSIVHTATYLHIDSACVRAHIITSLIIQTQNFWLFETGCWLTLAKWGNRYRDGGNI